MFQSLRRDFDPLDREILERAFCAALATLKAKRSVSRLNDDEALATILHSKLIEIAQTDSLTDAEALRDVLLDRLMPAKP
jgi:hypothetical protein